MCRGYENLIYYVVTRKDRIKNIYIIENFGIVIWL